MLDIIEQPWPWYLAGPLIGLTVPALLIQALMLQNYSLHFNFITGHHSK
jgi:hypothetical protein